MKIEDMISGKNDQGKIDINGIEVPVGALRRLFNEGYLSMRIYEDNQTFSMWGKNCTACFTFEQLTQRAG